MASVLSTSGKNAALDGVTMAYLSLHSGDPGATGANNELTGGTPAYARKAATFAAANAASRALSGDVTFDVPAGSTVAYVGIWTAVAGTYMGCFDVTDEVFASQGQYKLLATTTTVGIS